MKKILGYLIVFLFSSLMLAMEENGEQGTSKNIDFNQREFALFKKHGATILFEAIKEGENAKFESLLKFSLSESGILFLSNMERIDFTQSFPIDIIHEGKSLLEQAITCGNAEVVRLLLEKGALPISSHNKTLLFNEVYNNDRIYPRNKEAILDLLLKNGVIFFDPKFFNLKINPFESEDQRKRLEEQLEKTLSLLVYFGKELPKFQDIGEKVYPNSDKIETLQSPLQHTIFEIHDAHRAIHEITDLFRGIGFRNFLIIHDIDLASLKNSSDMELFKDFLLSEFIPQDQYVLEQARRIEDVLKELCHSPKKIKNKYGIVKRNNENNRYKENKKNKLFKYSLQVKNSKNKKKYPSFTKSLELNSLKKKKKKKKENQGSTKSLQLSNSEDKSKNKKKDSKSKGLLKTPRNKKK